MNNRPRWLGYVLAYRTPETPDAVREVIEYGVKTIREGKSGYVELGLLKGDLRRRLGENVNVRAFGGEFRIREDAEGHARRLVKMIPQEPAHAD